MGHNNNQSSDLGAIPVRVGLSLNPVPPNGAPGATIGTGVTYNSGPIPANGCSKIAIGVTLDQTGTMTLQRYIDSAGVVAIGPLITQAIVAAIPAWVVANDTLPWASFVFTIHNTGGAPANVTNFALLETA